MPLRAVFFDIDGTLVDSNEFHVMAWEETFRHHGHRISKDDIRQQIGKGADQLIPSLLSDVDGKTQTAMAGQHGEIFRSRYLHQVKPLPHASDLIEMLDAKGKKVVLASSADSEEVQHYIELLKLERFLTAAVSKDDVASSKPAGDIFAAALAQVFPFNPGETLVVGDTPYDVESALRCEIKAIALRSGGFSEEVLWEAGATYVYSSVKELFEKFDETPLSEP